MDEGGVLKPLVVDAETSSNATLKANWGFGNQLYLSSVCRPPHQGSLKQLDALSAENQAVFKLKWNLDMQSRHMRELVCQSRLIFMRVQADFADKHAANNNFLDRQLSERLVHHSQQYRVAIKACTTAIRHHLKEGGEEKEEGREEREEGGEERGVCEMMEMAELAWSLCEVLLFTHQHEMGVVSGLMQWCRARFDDRQTLKQVLSHPQPHLHPLYWSLVTTMVMQGSMQEACAMLRHHPQPHPSLSTLLFLISNMPPYAPESVSEWVLKRRQWRQVCREHVQDAVFAEHPHLLSICRILSGDEDVFVEHVHLLPSWYHLLISQLFFQHPFIPPSDLRLHSTVCLERYGVQGGMTAWDEVLMSILHLDVKEAIATCCKSFSNWWLPCHLTDLLHHANLMPHNILSYGSDIREYLTLDYASSLLSCPSLVETALDYLSSCAVYGRWQMKEVVDRLPTPMTRLQAHKLMAVCRRHALQAEWTQVGRRHGMQAMGRGMFSSALEWCVITQDTELSVELVKRIMRTCALADLRRLDILSHLPHTLTFSNHLVFLGKLVEYERSVEEGRVTEAMDVLMTLFAEKHVSKSYWGAMFKHLLHVLQQHKPALSRQCSMRLLEHVDEHGNDDVTTLSLRELLAHSLASFQASPLTSQPNSFVAKDIK